MIYREDDASQRVIYNVDIAYQNYKQHYYHNYVVKKLSPANDKICEVTNMFTINLLTQKYKSFNS